MIVSTAQNSPICFATQQKYLRDNVNGGNSLCMTVKRKLNTKENIAYLSLKRYVEMYERSLILSMPEVGEILKDAQRLRSNKWNNN